MSLFEVFEGLLALAALSETFAFVEMDHCLTLLLTVHRPLAEDDPNEIFHLLLSLLLTQAFKLLLHPWYVIDKAQQCF